MRNRPQLATAIKFSEYAFIAAESFEPESGSIGNLTTYTKYDNVHLILITQEFESDSLRCFQQMFNLSAHVQKIPIKWEDAVQLIVKNNAVGALCCCQTEAAIFTIEELCALREIPVPKNAAKPTVQATNPQATQSTEKTQPAPATPDATDKVENAFKNNAALLNRLNQNASRNAAASSNMVTDAFNNSSFLKNMSTKGSPATENKE